MKRIVCDDCGKAYDYERDEFCPKCGAFNQPVKTWGMDAAGNVVRVDGVNERDHRDSFVHKEVHHEKDVRRRVGMDWQPPKKVVKKSSAHGNEALKKLLVSPLVKIGTVILFLFALNYILLFVNMLLARW